jgi:AAA+ ATPase superfamily predicted ATPase
VILPATIDQIERLLHEDVAGATKLVRSVLFEEGGSEDRGSFGDALAILAKTSTQHRNLAPLIIRVLAAPNVIPAPNANNQIARNVVELAMASLPELCAFLGLSSGAQTYQNFDILKGTHERICSLLSPMKREKSSLEIFLTARHPIAQCLHHSAVEAYCAPFGLATITNKVEHIFSLVRKISTSDQIALNHQIKIFQATVHEYKNISTSRDNFLTSEYFVPFLEAADLSIENFLAETRGRYAATISTILAQDNSIQKHYPLQEEREFTILIPLRNGGPGTALNVQAELAHNEEQIIFGSAKTNLGAVPPGNFSAAFDALVMKTSQVVSTILTLSWEEMGSLEQKSLAQEVVIHAQRSGIPWHTLKYARPYSTGVAKGTDFVGRREKVISLANNILRTPMEPFFVTGQKRVGKTSLALAAADFARTQSPDLTYTYVLWGGIAYENPRDSINALGKEIVDLIERTLPGRPNLGKINFDGSLAPALPLVRHAYEINHRKKYVLIIDEFDEIHPELYLQGNLAETFFANLRALAASENLCLVLIGGENMPFIMERQGQKLNKFVRFGLDYFSRVDEWEDFKQLVRKPTENQITWYDEAITAIFNATNGNPYFAKTICANVYTRCLRERDADVTAEEIKQAIQSEVTSLDINSFAHLWQDGIYRAGVEREPFILQRCRVLVAIARSIRHGGAITLPNLVANKHSTQLQPADISAVLNDFVRREILIERDGRHEFLLPIFELWLRDVGIARLVSDALAQDLAEAAQAEEDRSYVQSSEIVTLASNWPTFRGKKIGTDEIRAWLEQVTSQKDQRLLFTLLQKLRVFSDIEAREKLKVAFSFLRPKLPEFVIRKRDGRTNVVVTYVDGEGKSGQYYASRFAEENQIPARAILSPSKFSILLESYTNKNEVAAITIVDDIIATGETLSKKLPAFIRENEVAVRKLGAPLIVVSITATDIGQEKVRESMEEFDWLDFELRTCEPLTSDLFAFSKENSIWQNTDDFDRASALCRDLGVNIYRDSPLGYGDQALLVVFPETCPNNTLPIIHSPSRQNAARRWSPLFPRIVN